ncbi:hypothetical protein QYE76_042093 [Lolium multiflorum]|uniref:AP2/ERF domain-containing protein n=1 Tax=Lolium multiflorum TaxID=4521 RepID=A0AAD8TE71_LOLMU|nr:hypothetical protein QYE76_042093 [Lolium multiflorum]
MELLLHLRVLLALRVLKRKALAPLLRSRGLPMAPPRRTSMKATKRYNERLRTLAWLSSAGLSARSTLSRTSPRQAATLVPRAPLHTAVAASLLSRTCATSCGRTQACPHNDITNALEFLQLYTVGIHAARGDHRIMANWFPMALKEADRAWLMNLPVESISMWDDLCTIRRQLHGHLRVPMLRRTTSTSASAISATRIPKISKREIISAGVTDVKTREKVSVNDDLDFVIRLFEIADRCAKAEEGRLFIHDAPEAAPVAPPSKSKANMSTSARNRPSSRRSLSRNTDARTAPRRAMTTIRTTYFIRSAPITLKTATSSRSSMRTRQTAGSVEIVVATTVEVAVPVAVSVLMARTTKRRTASNLLTRQMLNNNNLFRVRGAGRWGAGRTKFKETRHPVYRGVRRRGNAGRWVREVHVPGQRGERLWLGTYLTAESAARAHDATGGGVRVNGGRGRGGAALRARGRRLLLRAASPAAVVGRGACVL